MFNLLEFVAKLSNYLLSSSRICTFVCMNILSLLNARKYKEAQSF